MKTAGRDWFDCGCTLAFWLGMLALLSVGLNQGLEAAKTLGLMK